MIATYRERHAHAPLADVDGQPRLLMGIKSAGMGETK